MRRKMMMRWSWLTPLPYIYIYIYIAYIYIYIDNTLVELHPNPRFSQIRDVEDFEDPPEIHEALLLKVFAKTKRSRRRISAPELCLSRSQRLTRLNASHTSWPPGGKKGLRSYVYSESRVPSEEKGERCEGTKFDMLVGESCGKCKNACNAKLEISTTQSVSRASTNIS